MSTPDVVLFDLDGTLTDSGPGITRSVAYAVQRLGLPALSGAALRRFVGPPLQESFAAICGFDAEVTGAAVDAYREYFTRTGIFENTVYDGIPSLLDTLRRNGRRLAVATSKPTVYAAQILRQLNLADYFEVTCGAGLDGSSRHKHEVITAALAALELTRPTSALMVGDRQHDIIGARRCGLRSVGVTWGYGTAAELLAAGADALAAAPHELLELFGE